MIFDIEERLKQLPDKPGVYLMKDVNDTVIYVGKAKSLRKRVRQYFGSYGQSSVKVNSMVKRIADFEYIIVENEVESLILEQNFIKRLNPKYNILLRDDKQYPYIKITLKDTYPRVLKTRRRTKDGSKYFGPYPSATAVYDAIEIFQELYPIRDCSLNLEKNIGKVRPCLNYYIGKCIGPCTGNVKKEEYMAMIDEISSFLSEKNPKIPKNLEEKMKKAAENLDFEEAAKIRDKLNSLNNLKEKQNITSANSELDRDVIGIARGMHEICIQIFLVRDGKIVDREHFFIEDRFNDSDEEFIVAFLKQYYANASFVPKEVLIPVEIDEEEGISTWLSEKRGSKVYLTRPQKGEKANILQMAKENALDMLTKYREKYKIREQLDLLALEEIADLLNLRQTPMRIEAYDISNISGAESVGSMVVFEKGRSLRSDYRKFKIRTVKGPDDYASMEEVLRRRFLKVREESESSKLTSFSIYPDLIMMDGGKGQVNVAKRILEDLGLDIPVCGLVKDDFHTTRGIIYENEEYILDLNSPGYKMIYKIQEEAHRFALNYHHSLRNKALFKSELDFVEGIGPKRKNELMKHFKSISRIKNASVEELLEVKSMNRSSAEKLYNYFNGGKDVNSEEISR